MKHNVVTYSHTPFKGICIPFSHEKADAVRADDLVYWRKERAQRPEKDLLTFRRDEKFLYIEFTRFKETPVQVFPPDEKGNLWAEGDIAELLFGAIDGESYLIQLAVGASGGRFDSTGDYDSWSAHVTRAETSWKASISIVLEKLLLQDQSCSFDIFINDSDTGTVVCWNPVRISFHEFENYGRLFFCNNYEEAFFALTNRSFSGKAPLTRNLFEEKINSELLPAEAILHGPWLSNMEEHSVTIAFSTAGLCAAFVEYRKAGEGPWIRRACSLQNAVVSRSGRLHIKHLTDLEEGTLYEYRLLTTLIAAEEEIHISQIRSFRTFSVSTREFSFAIYSDTHSNTAMLRQKLNLPAAQKADFLVDLGDLLSSTSGPSGYYEGFLDMECSILKGERPTVFCRGNHEQIGIFARTYNELFPKPSNRTFYAFRQGEICFIVLDAGNDHKDDLFHDNETMIREEKEFLSELKKSDLYCKAAKRIGFIHIPPQDLCRFESERSYELVRFLALDGLFCGHLHNYMKMTNGTVAYRTERSVREKVPLLPFPVIATDTDTILTLHVSGSVIQGTAYLSNGEVLDTFTI